MINKLYITPSIFKMPVHEALISLLSSADNILEHDYAFNVTYKDIRFTNDEVTASFIIKINEFTHDLHSDILNLLENSIGDFDDRSLWNKANINIMFEFTPNNTSYEVIIHNHADILKQLVFLKKEDYFNSIFAIKQTKTLKNNTKKNNICSDKWKDFLHDYNGTKEETTEAKNEPIDPVELAKETNDIDTILINAIANVANKFGYSVDKDILLTALKK